MPTHVADEGAPRGTRWGAVAAPVVVTTNGDGGLRVRRLARAARRRTRSWLGGVPRAPLIGLGLGAGRPGNPTPPGGITGALLGRALRVAGRLLRGRCPCRSYGARLRACPRPEKYRSAGASFSWWRIRALRGRAFSDTLLMGCRRGFGDRGGHCNRLLLRVHRDGQRLFGDDCGTARPGGGRGPTSLPWPA